MSKNDQLYIILLYIYRMTLMQSMIDYGLNTDNLDLKEISSFWNLYLALMCLG